MPNINLLLSGAQFILSLIDLKQQLLTGTQHSNSFFRSNNLKSTLVEVNIVLACNPQPHFFRL